MIEIQVKLFATLVQLVPETIRARYPGGIRAGFSLDVTLPEDSTLADLVDLLALPREKVRVVFVNGRARPFGYHLVAGDKVGMFPPVGGG